MYFDKLLDSQILLLLFLHTLLLCNTLLFGCWIFHYHPGVKQFGSSGSKLFVKINNRQQKSPIAGKQLNTIQFVDTTFWLKPWLKVISFGSNFFQLAKVLATTNSEPGLVLQSDIDLFVFLFVLLLYVPSQQLWSLQDGQFT